MALDYAITPLPATWPGDTKHPVRSPFKTQWTRTLQLLAREIKHLGGRRVEIAVDVAERDVRLDGMLRADARPRSPRVIVSFTTSKGTRLSFPCGTYGFWQDNVYAIAKALENLRAVERWGVSSRSQYEGFKALPGAGGTTETMDLVAAVKVVEEYSEIPGDSILRDAGWATTAIRKARAETHPDRNAGDHTRWNRLETARQVLEAHHRRS